MRFYLLIDKQKTKTNENKLQADSNHAFFKNFSFYYPKKKMCLKTYSLYVKRFLWTTKPRYDLDLDHIGDNNIFKGKTL